MLLWIIIFLCLLGMYKGWNAYFGCIKSDALVPALNMLLMAMLFLCIILINLYLLNNYDINKKFNLESYEQRIKKTGMYSL